MKLIVTGHDESGRAVFCFAGAPPRESGPGSYELWSTKGPLVVPDASDPSEPASIGYFPSEGETCFKVVRVPGASSRSAQQALPADIATYFDAEDPGMHTTDTLDYVIVLGGTAELELDEGRRQSVAAGDCVVQRGTRHAWRVTSEEPLVLGAVMIGARRKQ